MEKLPVAFPSLTCTGESCETVDMDLTEHQGFAWATEDKIRNLRIGKSEHSLTN